MNSCEDCVRLHANINTHKYEVARMDCKLSETHKFGTFEGKCVIYGLYADGDDVNGYVGSTHHFQTRMCQHRCVTANANKRLKSWMQRNCRVVRVIILDVLPKEEIQTRLIREQQFMDMMKPTLNVLRATIPGRIVSQSRKNGQ